MNTPSHTYMEACHLIRQNEEKTEIFQNGALRNHLQFKHTTKCCKTRRSEMLHYSNGNTYIENRDGNQPIHPPCIQQQRGHVHLEYLIDESVFT